MTKTTYLPLLLAGLLAAAGAQAQSTPAAGSSDGPPKAGEASTQTMGVPNAQTTNSPASEAPIPNDRAAVAPDARTMGNAAVTSNVPPKAGEASTFVGGAPNLDPMMPHALSRAEVHAQLMNSRANFEATRRTMSNPDARYGVAGMPQR